jgi:hypothetical protein
VTNEGERILMTMQSATPATARPRRPYEAPQIVYDAELTAQAGSPFGGVSEVGSGASDPLNIYSKK